MRKLNLKKIITMGLITTSILAVVPVGANAEWRQSNTGWWYSKANGGYSIGWDKIGNSWYYFDDNGYMKAGWVKDNGNWYYLKADGTMATGTVLTDGQISSFTNNGVWQGYVNNGNNNTNTNSSNNSTNGNNNTQASTTTQTTSSNDGFTFEKAIEILKVIDDGQFYCEGLRTNIEYTKGGYNGYPVEDKVYTLNDGTKDLKYRIIGVIDKSTGEYYGVMRVFEIGYAAEYPNYANIAGFNSDLTMSTSESTFDKKGDWKAKLNEKLDIIKQSEEHANNLSKDEQQEKADKDEMDKMMTNPAYRQAHQAEYEALVQKLKNK